MVEEGLEMQYLVFFLPPSSLSVDENDDDMYETALSRLASSRWPCSPALGARRARENDNLGFEFQGENDMRENRASVGGREKGVDTDEDANGRAKGYGRATASSVVVGGRRE